MRECVLKGSYSRRRLTSKPLPECSTVAVRRAAPGLEGEPAPNHSIDLHFVSHSYIDRFQSDSDDRQFKRLARSEALQNTLHRHSPRHQSQPLSIDTASFMTLWGAGVLVFDLRNNDVATVSREEGVDVREVRQHPPVRSQRSRRAVDPRDPVLDTSHETSTSAFRALFSAESPSASWKPRENFQLNFERTRRDPPLRLCQPRCVVRARLHPRDLRDPRRNAA